MHKTIVQNENPYKPNNIFNTIDETKKAIKAHNAIAIIAKKAKMNGKDNIKKKIFNHSIFQFKNFQNF